MSTTSDQLALSFTPASRASGNKASKNAEAKVNRFMRSDDCKRVLLGFYSNPDATVAQMCDATGMSRHVAGRRAFDLYAAGLLSREDKVDGFHCTVTLKGLDFVRRIREERR